jgi:Family of unknown function (DUF6535)
MYSRCPPRPSHGHTESAIARSTESRGQLRSALLHILEGRRGRQQDSRALAKGRGSDPHFREPLCPHSYIFAHKLEYSQGTSSFYLGNVYQVLTDPNVTHSSLPSPVVIGLNQLCSVGDIVASMDTSISPFGLPVRCSTGKRARMRAFFVNGVGTMHVPWAVEVLPTLQHLSLFLVFGGLAIFLFNVDHEVFSYVVWWIGVFSIVHGLITPLSIVRHDSPYAHPSLVPAYQYIICNLQISRLHHSR